MRLLDSINGLKWAQMNFFLHITMFMAAFTINKSPADPVPVVHHDSTDAHEATTNEHGAADTSGEHAAQNTSGSAHHATLNLHRIQNHHRSSSFADSLDELTFDLDEMISKKDRLLKKLKTRQFQEATFDENYVMSWEEYAVQFSATGHDEAPYTPEQQYQWELRLFNWLKYTHLALFSLQMGCQLCKRMLWHDLAQICSALIICVASTPMVYNVYYTKKRLAFWEANDWQQMNEIRLWLFIEVIYFFAWLGNGATFLFFAYWFKLKPIAKEFQKAYHNLDDNPWNEKYSDDFMRYIKAEMYSVAECLTNLEFYFTIGFSNFYNIASIGTRDWFPTEVIFLIMIVDNIGLLWFWVYAMANQLDPSSNKFKKIFAVYWGLHIVTCFLVYYLYYTYGMLDGQSLICRVYIKIILMDLLCGWAFPIFWGFRMGIQGFIKDWHAKKLDASNENRSISELGGLRRSQSMLDTETKVKKGMLDDKIKDKETMEFEEDFTTMTCFCFLKKNVDEFMIGPDKRAALFHSCLIVQSNVLAMLLISGYAIYSNDGGDYKLVLSHSFPLFYVKIACVIALHFVLHPEVSKGLNLMKLAHQHPYLFVEYGDQISFILGLGNVSLAIICEFLNLYMLVFQHTISHAIIHFVAFEVIIELGKMYYESLMNNQLKSVVHHPPKLQDPDNPLAKKWGQEKVRETWSERACFHKVSRIVYKIIRAFYVSVNFYFIPWIVMYWQFMIPDKAGEEQAASSH